MVIVSYNPTANHALIAQAATLAGAALICTCLRTVTLSRLLALGNCHVAIVLQRYSSLQVLVLLPLLPLMGATHIRVHVHFVATWEVQGRQN